MLREYVDEYGRTCLDLSKYKMGKPTMHPNKINIPVNNFSFTEEDISEFNQIYQFLLKNKERLREFVYTPSNGISIKRGNIKGQMWGITKTKTVVEIDFKDSYGYYRFILSSNHKKDDPDALCGKQAYKALRRELEKDDINLDDYAIANGLEIKKTIPSPKIELFARPEITYTNVHHADLNSAFPAGMSKSFPQLKHTFERLYDKRKEKPIYKNILNLSQGVFQSILTQYRFSHISKAGYEFTNNAVDELSEKLINNGYRILCYNTDGIWYKETELSPKTPYEDDTFGPSLGQWKTDHKNCKARFKSKGVYEYIEDNIYHPVVRGQTTLDKVKPREEWEWGDIFKAIVIEYKFIEGVGIIRVNN